MVTEPFEVTNGKSRHGG